MSKRETVEHVIIGNKIKNSIVMFRVVQTFDIRLSTK